MKAIVQENRKWPSPRIFYVRGNHENAAKLYLEFKKLICKQYTIEENDFDTNLEHYKDSLIKKTKDKLAEKKDLKNKLASVNDEINEAKADMLTRIVEYHVDHPLDTSSQAALLESTETFRGEHSDLVSHLVDLTQIKENVEEKLQKFKLEAATMQAENIKFRTLYEEYYKVKTLLLSLDNPAQFGRNKLWLDELQPHQAEGLCIVLADIPYIITSDDFNLVHAALPFSDTELQQRVSQGNLELSSDEKNYAIWARIKNSEVLIDPSQKADIKDRYTVCGHTIAEGLRAASKHINIDFGAYAYGCIAMLNLQTRTIELIGDKTKTFKTVKQLNS